MRSHNLLLMDERGTGASTPIDCKQLQQMIGAASLVDTQRAIEACGAQLNRSFLRTDGTGYVHASDLFATPQSVRDLVAIVGALGLPPVDLYGDSYGSFFAQAFAVNHPELVRSVVLDSTYPLDQDQFDAPARQELRFAYDALCTRSLACHAAAPGSSTARIRRLARRLATAPLVTAAGVYGGDGSRARPFRTRSGRRRLGGSMGRTRATRTRVDRRTRTERPGNSRDGPGAVAATRNGGLE